MAMPALEIRDLHAWYGESHVLHGMALEVPSPSSRMPPCSASGAE